MTGWYPLAQAQEQVLRLHAGDPTGVKQSTVRAFDVSGVAGDRLQRAVDLLVRRHEPLRTVYGDGQRILSDMDITVCADEFAMAPFDVGSGPLLRVWLHGDRLVLHAHLLVADGWSWRVLCDDLGTAYRGTPLPKLNRQYVDWALWQRERSTTALRDWWARRLDGMPMTLPIPKPGTRGDGWATRPLRIERRVHTRTVVLATALARALGRHTGCDRVVIGLATANRTHPETHRMLGFFVHSVPLAVDLTVDDVSGAVATAMSAAYDHAGVAFAPPQVNFVYQPVDSLGLPRLGPKVTERPVAGIAKFPLTIRAEDNTVRAEYDTDAVDGDWVDDVLDDFVRALR
jgi:hypothetical protein